jgi:putative ABC transport system permease protein
VIPEGRSRILSGRFADRIGRAASALRLERGLSGPTLVSMALAAAAVGAVLGALTPTSLPALHLGVPPLPVAHGGDWDAAWSASARPPVMLQLEGLQRLAGLLGGLVLAVAAVACVDLAFLTVALGGSRRHEIAVRSAVGAGRRALGGERRMEAGVLGLATLAAAALLALGGAEALRTSWPAADWPVTARCLGWAVVGAALVAALAAALYPALHWLGAPPGLRLEPLALGDHTTDASGDAGLARALAASQVAVAMALVVVSGLLVRAGVARPATGDATPVPDTLLVSLDLSRMGAARRADLVAALPGRVVAAVHSGRTHDAGAGGDPARMGVAARGGGDAAGSRGISAGTGSEGAWLGIGTTDMVQAECAHCRIGEAAMPLVPAWAQEQAVSPGFFTALAVPLLAGRGVEPADGPGSAPAAWVNQAYVRSVLQGSEPLGRRVLVGGPAGQWHTIVGVVADIHPAGVGAGDVPRPTVYLSALQHPPRHLTLAVRVDRPTAHAGDVAYAVTSLAGAGAITGVTTLASSLARFAAPLRWAGAVSAVVGGLALLLALLGVYALMATATARRRAELGLRAAVGARRRSLLALVMGEALGLAGIGVALGSVLALSLGRLLQSVATGVRLDDPLLFAAAAAGTAAAVLAGAWRPARRAATVPPAQALTGRGSSHAVLACPSHRSFSGRGRQETAQ